MNTTTPTTNRETYQQQLRRIAQAMATARSSDVYADLEPGSQPEMLKLFVDGNLDKRLDKLDKGLELVKEALGDDFEPLAIEFIKALPMGAYDSGQYDGEKFLAWLVDHKSLSPVQRDHVACQRARNAVENMARNQRLAHVQFHDLASVAGKLSEELDSNPTLWIHLNPIRVWARFETGALLDEESDEPSDVIFFAVGKDITTAVLETEGRQMIEELASLQPVSLASWAALSEDAERDELIELGAELAEMVCVSCL